MITHEKGNRTMSKILISMPKDFLSQVDKFALSEHRTRSELIREALRSYIKRSNMPNIEKANRNATILEELIG